MPPAIDQPSDAPAVHPPPQNKDARAGKARASIGGHGGPPYLWRRLRPHAGLPVMPLGGGCNAAKIRRLMIAIVDYRAGNLTSVKRALEHLGHRECEITDRPDRIRSADRVTLPGVGAAGATMKNLRAL